MYNCFAINKSERYAIISRFQVINQTTTILIPPEFSHFPGNWMAVTNPASKFTEQENPELFEFWSNVIYDLQNGKSREVDNRLTGRWCLIPIPNDCQNVINGASLNFDWEPIQS